MINNCDNDKLNKQKEWLEQEIYFGENDSFFKVVNLECGTGKSRTVEEIFAKKCEGNYFNYLYVVLRNADAIKSAERINALAGETIAIAVNTDTYNLKEFNKVKNKLKDYKVVIISHEKYKALAVDTSNRKYFTENRDTLVIDEFLDMTAGNELIITKKYLEGLETLLQYRSLRELFAECTKDIEDYLLMDKPSQTFFNAKTDFKIINTKVNKLIALIKNNIHTDMLSDSGLTKTQLINNINNIKQFYNQTCVVENNVMYCINKNYDYWYLTNNIILDATAQLNMAYKLSSNFYVQTQRKVLDHNNWNFYIINTNTCKSAKDRAVNFYETINNMVSKNGIKDTLVISNKADYPIIKADYKNYFGNVTGSNEYKDLKNVIIAHNPNKPFREYVLQYLYYSNIKLTNRNKWVGKKVGSGDNQIFRFKEKKFEEYRQSKNAEEIYQAIKRVNRNMSKDTKVFILNNDTETINKVLEMFKGNYKIKRIDNVIKFQKAKKEKLEEHNLEQKENSYATKFIKLLDEIHKLKHIELQATKKDRKGQDVVQQGLYSKNDIREYLKMSNKKHFSDYVLNNAEVLNYVNNHNIKICTRYLDFTMYR